MKAIDDSSDYYKIKNKVFKKIIRIDKIEETVKTIATKINADYKNKKPLFIIVLKGSIFFASDLLRHINLSCQIDAISAKSYGYSMTSTGQVKLTVPDIDIKDKDVIIIEDIVDTGYTISKLIDRLKLSNPSSLEVAAFLSKPTARKIKVDVKYIGIEIPPDFVIGYGLDYAEEGRQLPEVYSLNENM